MPRNIRTYQKLIKPSEEQLVDAVNEIIESVNTVSASAERENYKGKPGDVKVNKVANNKYDFYVRGEDGWHRDTNSSYGPVNDSQTQTDTQPVILSNGTIDNQYRGSSRILLNLDASTSITGVANPKIEITGNGTLSSTGKTTIDSAGDIELNADGGDLFIKDDTSELATINSSGLKINNISAADSDTDKFLVSDSGLVKYRTGAQILTDLGITADEILDWTADQGSNNIHASNFADITSTGTLDISGGTLTTSAAQKKSIVEGVAANTDIGAYEFRARTFQSDATTLSGTAPFTVASTVKVANLNADKLDGADLVDEDNMASNSAVKVPTQQSVKAYVDSEITGLVDSAPGALDTLNELAAALNDDASFSTTVTNSLALKSPLAAPAFTGNATFDSTTLVIDSSNDRVGIGTASPNADLQIHSASGTKLWITAGGSNPADAAAIRLSEQENGSSNYFELDYNGSSNILAFHSNNQNDMFSMYRNGNTIYTGDATKFGVGTSSLQNKFQIYHTAADGDDGMMIVRDDTSTADGDLLGGIGFDSTDGNVPSSVLESSAFIAAYAAEAQGTGDKGADLVFGATLINDDDDTVSHEYMRITDNGDIGIGTASAIAALTVKSNSTSSGNSGFTLMDNSDTNPIVQIGEKSTDGGRLHMYDGGTLKVSLYTDGTDNFINAGNVGIGTTSPSVKLHVDSSTSDTVAIFKSSDSTARIQIQDDDTTNHIVSNNSTLSLGANNTTHAGNLNIDSNGRLGVGVTDPDSKVEIIGEGDSNSTKSLEIKDSGGTNLFFVRDDGVVSVTHNYLFVQAGGIYSTYAIRARGGITDDGGALGLGSDGSTNHFIITSGNITTGVWNGTPIASAYLDADTAHLSGAQTFTGTKQFNSAFPQITMTDDSATDKVEVGLSGNAYYHKTSDTGINFGWRDNSNNDLLTIDTSAQTLTIGEGSQETFALKIGDNGRMNMPQRGLEFENAHGYFSPLGDMHMPLYINVTQTDLIRFQTPLTWEYYNYVASAYVDDMSNVANLQNMLDGRRGTNYAVSNTKRKFRFVITRATSWADDHLFYIENTWSSIGSWSSSAAGGGSLTPTMVVERLDGSFDADDDTNNDWSTNAGITTDWHTTGIWDGFGLAMYYSTGMHNSETHIRITVTFPEFADASKEINIKNIGAMSSYSSQNTNQDAFVQDFNRNLTGNGSISIPTGDSYKINGTGVISATQLGTTVVASSLTSVGTLTGLALSGALTTTSTIDGRDVAADGVLATNALPKAGGTLTGALSIHSASDALFNLRTGDDSWAYMQFQQNDGTRRAYIGMDGDLDTLIINATENGATKINLNSTTTTISNSLNIGGHSFDDIDIGSEFVDSDNHIMSSGAIKEKIEGYSYVTANQDTTGTAAIATTVTVADESSDTDCFPLYSTASTGNQAPKSGTNLRFNSNTGLLTATKFAGTHEATGVGATGNQSLDSATNTAAEYAALPVGYAHMMHSSLGTDEGMPLDGKYFYFTKIANRDSGGGWGGLAFAYSEPWKAYLGFTTTDGDFATWNKMLVEDASGNVGIGTTSPSHLLHLDGDNVDGEAILVEGHASYGGTIRYQRGTSYSWRAGVGGGSSTNSNIPASYWGIEDVSDSHTPALVVAHSTQNVGIGLTNPSETLHVDGNVKAVDGDFSGDVDVDGTMEADVITVNGTALNTVIAGVTVTNATTAAVATTVTITDNESTDEDNAIIFAAGADTDGGNLGLESDGHFTYNPSDATINAGKLNLSGSGVNITNDGATELNFNGTGNTNITTAGNMYIKAGSSKKMYLGANATDSLVTLDTNGSLGIGTTSPTSTLHISDASNSGVTSLSLNNRVKVRGDGVVTWGSAAAHGTLSWDSGKTLINSQGTNDLQISAGGNHTDHIYIDGGGGSTDGYVGVGTNSPTTKLDVEGSVSYKHISLTADSDDLDVSGCTVVECTPSGTDRLGGFTGGVQGQVIHVLKVDSGLGRLIIEHNEGTGNQDIFLSSAADVMLAARGGITLYCNGTSWFGLDK